MSIDWLPRALEESRARGFLGPGPISPQIEHARGFADVWAEHRPGPPTRFLDLGSGGGLPGLLLLEEWSTHGVLLDSMIRRTDFLREVLEWAGAPRGGTVVTGRAEDLARLPDFDGAFDLVTARSFGPPAVTAECATRFLQPGGVLLVSEPPDAEREGARWPSTPLDELGLRLVAVEHATFSFAVMEKFAATEARFPRRSGVPSKRPLFSTP